MLYQFELDIKKTDLPDSTTSSMILERGNSFAVWKAADSFGRELAFCAVDVLKEYTSRLKREIDCLRLVTFSFTYFIFEKRKKGERRVCERLR